MPRIYPGSATEHSSRPLTANPATCQRMNRVIALVLVVVVFIASSVTLAVAGMLPGSVTLAWDPSTSPAVSGYRVHYGTASHSYQYSIDVGSATTATIFGLTSAVRYYFAVTAYDASGLESPFSDEIVYVSGGATLGLGFSPTGQPSLSGIAPPGKTYNVLASQDLRNWSVIGTVVADANGSVSFVDPSRLARRCYRLQQTSP